LNSKVTKGAPKSKKGKCAPAIPLLLTSALKTTYKVFLIIQVFVIVKDNHPLFCYLPSDITSQTLGVSCYTIIYISVGQMVCQAHLGAVKSFGRRKHYCEIKKN
jgi:hypothetical protein